MTARPILAFVALVLVAGAQLVFDPLLAQPLPGLLGVALRFGGISIILFVIGQPSRPDAPLVIWSGVLLLTLPVLMTAASGSVSGFTELLIFTLIPVGVVFAQAQQGAELIPLLGPTLAGFGGASLVLPYSIPATSAGRCWLAALVAGALLSGFALVGVAGRLEGRKLLDSAAHLALGTAFMAGLFCWIGWRNIAASPGQAWLLEGLRVLVEAALLLLSTYLIRAIGSVRYAARYLLVPLAGVAISFGMERPPPGWTLGLGAALMLGSALLLLRHPADASH